MIALKHVSGHVEKKHLNNINRGKKLNINFQLSEHQPSSSGGVMPPKRKYQRKSAPLQSAKRAPKQPKVITVVDDLRWWENQNQNQNAVSESFRSRAGVKNFQAIATGSLLSPDRTSRRTPAPPSSDEVELLTEPAAENPCADLNVLDFIEVEDELLGL